MKNRETVRNDDKSIAKAPYPFESFYGRTSLGFSERSSKVSILDRKAPTIAFQPCSEVHAGVGMQVHGKLSDIFLGPGAFSATDLPKIPTIPLFINQRITWYNQQKIIPLNFSLLNLRPHHLHTCKWRRDLSGLVPSWRLGRAKGHLVVAWLRVKGSPAQMFSEIAAAEEI